MICCLSCNYSVTWQNSEMKRDKDLLLNGAKMADLKQRSKMCWIFAMKKSFEVILKSRNVVHLSPKKVEPFLKGISGARIENFQKIKDLNHLCKEIYFAAIALALALSRSTFFDESVKKRAEEVEKRIDNHFCYDTSGSLRFCSDLSKQKRYKDFIVEKFEKLEERVANMEIATGIYFCFC